MGGRQHRDQHEHSDEDRQGEGSAVASADTIPSDRPPASSRDIDRRIGRMSRCAHVRAAGTSSSSLAFALIRSVAISVTASGGAPWRANLVRRCAARASAAVLGCIVIAAGIARPGPRRDADEREIPARTKPQPEDGCACPPGPRRSGSSRWPTGAVPDIAPATQQYPMWALTSTMSANAGAIAGVNGDFGTGRGQPVHTLMIDGELWTTGQAQGRAVAWSSDGSRAYVGHPALRIKATGSAGALFHIHEWNALAPDLDVDRGIHLARGFYHDAARQDEPRKHRSEVVRRATRAEPRDRMERLGTDVARPQVHGGGAARALSADAAGGGLHRRRRRPRIEILLRPWPTRCRRSPPVTR